jgi:hypothetical protein
MRYAVLAGSHFGLAYDWAFGRTESVLCLVRCGHCAILIWGMGLEWVDSAAGVLHTPWGRLYMVREHVYCT